MLMWIIFKILGFQSLLHYNIHLAKVGQCYISYSEAEEHIKDKQNVVSKAPPVLAKARSRLAKVALWH